MAKKLYRKQKGKMIGGVCAGLEDYLNVDVTVIRLLFVVLALITALIPMVIFYIIAWIIVPAEEESKA